MESTFAQLVAQGADAGQIAARAASTWRAVEAALSPVIGQRAVAALYKRCLALLRADYPWLTAFEAAPRGDDFALLQIALSQQTSSTALAAHQALLRTFHDLLTNFLGAPLTERLLRSVYETFSSDDAAQETSS